MQKRACLRLQTGGGTLSFVLTEPLHPGSIAHVSPLRLQPVRHQADSYGIGGTRSLGFIINDFWGAQFYALLMLPPRRNRYFPS